MGFVFAPLQTPSRTRFSMLISQSQGQGLVPTLGAFAHSVVKMRGEVRLTNVHNPLRTATAGSLAL